MTTETIKTETIKEDSDTQRVLEQGREKLRLAREMAHIMNEIRTLGLRVRMYEVEHDIVQNAARAATDQVRKVLDSIIDAELDVTVTVNGFEYHTVPLYESGKSIQDLVDACHSRSIGRIVFRRGVDEQELISLMVVVYKNPKAEEPFDRIREKLDALRVRHIVLEQRQDDEDTADVITQSRSRRESMGNQGQAGAGKQGARIAEPRWLYGACVEAIKEMTAQLQLGMELDIHNIGSLSSDLAWHLRQNPSQLVMLAMFRRLDQYTYTHPLNTAILVGAAACRMVESDQELGELIRAVLLVDVGNYPHANLPSMDANRLPKPEHRHPVYSAAHLDQVTSLSKLPMVLAFEHHLRHDFSGFPQQTFRWQLNYISALVTIADAFDRLTNRRDGRSTISPADALITMRRHVGVHWEPTLFEWFVTTVGEWPCGSLVQLHTGQMAMILESGERLSINILTDVTSQLMDQSRPSYATRPGRLPDEFTIVRSLDANDVPLNLLGFLPA